VLNFAESEATEEGTTFELTVGVLSGVLLLCAKERKVRNMTNVSRSPKPISSNRGDRINRICVQTSKLTLTLYTIQFGRPNWFYASDAAPPISSCV